MPDPTLQEILLRKATSIGPQQKNAFGQDLPLSEDKDYIGQAAEFIKGLVGFGEGRKTSNFLGQLLAAAPLAGVGKTEEAGGQLYSRLKRAFESLPEGATMHSSKALSHAKNLASKDEIAWTKLPEFLQGKPQVTREDILGHLGLNPVKVKETVLGAGSKAGGTEPEWPGERLTKYDRPDLLTPGGTDYRETLLQLETPRPQQLEEERDAIKKEIERLGLNFEITNPRMLENVGQTNLALRLRNYTQRADKAGNVYRSPHFPYPDLVVHTRSNTRELPGGYSKPLISKPEDLVGGKPALFPGEPVEEMPDEWMFPVPGTGYGIGTGTSNTYSGRGLTEQAAQKDLFDYLKRRPEGLPSEHVPGPKGTFLEEVQSDWNKAGYEHGYQTGKPPTAMDVDVAYDTYSRKLKEAMDLVGGGGVTDPSEQRLLLAINRSHDPEISNIAKEVNAAHDAWDNLRREYEGSGGKVPDNPFKNSWQDLALKNELLKVAKDPEKSWLGWTTGDAQAERYNLKKFLNEIRYRPSTRNLEADTPGDVGGFWQDNVAPEDLQRYIGPEATERLLAQPLEAHGPYGADPVHRLTDLNLEVGGEGKRHIYDKMLPAKMNRILKPFGGKVELGELPTGNTKQPLYGANMRPDNVDIVDQATNEPIASVFPRVQGAEQRGAVDNRTFDLIATLSKQNAKPEMFKAWITRLTPEMKDRIAKEGLPLLASLYGIWQTTQQGQEQQ